MSQPDRKLRIAVADDEPDMRMFFKELLPPLGHEVVAVAESGRRLVEQCRTARPDLVITDIRMPDMDGVEAAAEVNRHQEVPVILITAYHDVDILACAGEGHIMAYLVKPVKPIDLQAAISLAVRRFEHFQEAKQEAADLRHALEERKLIERAKGVIMKRLRVDEEDAFRRLRRVASGTNRKLAEVAREVVASEETFAELEKV